MSDSDLVILDRDGVINEDVPDHVRSPEAWRPIPGSLEAIARLTAAGHRVAVATNQSGLARGYLDRDTLAAIHARMSDTVDAAGGRLDAIVFCPHGPEEGCSCRKPEPGLLHEIAGIMRVSLDGVPFVGDSARDLEAAQRAGCIPVLVRTGHGIETEKTGVPAEVSVYDCLAAWVDAHLSAGKTAATGSSAS